MMSMKFKNILRALSLLVLLSSFVPLNHTVQAAAPLPLVDMFQLPWEQGLAWVAIDGFDNGSKRAVGSPHNYLNGGAIDFAPHNNMIKGENTSNFWVTAAADGRIVEISKCHMKIAHANGWVSEYQHLANIQVKLGDAVARNQRLAVIANASTQPVCPGSEPPDIPHLHFTLRPNMVGATFAGWEFRYSWFWNSTTFRKGNQTLGLYKPLLNVFDSQPAPTATAQATATPGNLPSATPTLFGPYISTEVNPANINIGESTFVTVKLNNVPVDGFTSVEITCPYDVSLFEVSNIVVAPLFGTDAATAINGPQNGRFIVAIAGSKGNRATTSGIVLTFSFKGLQIGQTYLGCEARVSKGDNVLTQIPEARAYLTVLGDTPTPDTTQSPASTSTPFPIPSSPTVFPSVTPTSITDNWLTFTNYFYGFQFKYPQLGQIASGGDNNFTRIDLPFVQGTNLREKYLEVVVAENINPCQSPLPTPNPSETVIINGITFLKQTGADAGVGHLHQWVAYSTLRNNACVSLDFILHSLNAGNFATPPPVFDFAAESAVFEQMVATYAWLAQVPTATPGFETPLPIESPTPTLTSTPAGISSPTPIFTSTVVMSPTPSGGNGAIAGQVTAGKPVIVKVYNASLIFVATLETKPDGTFQVEVPPGDYTVVASAAGFLRAQADVPSLNPEVPRILPPITLLAGDIDGNDVIDQLDAMTIGMNYNYIFPEIADLNGDAIINVLDLELLARNYRKMGPVVWE